MVVSVEKKTDVALKVVLAAKLCDKHGFGGWAMRMSKELIPRINTYVGPTCSELLEADELPGRGNVAVETFETMLCNQLSSYIDCMQLKSLPGQLPPFKFMNGIVLEHASSVGLLLTAIVIAHGDESESSTQCLDAGVPLEYLHTLIRAYHNKALLLGFLQKLHTDDFAGLFDKCNELSEQYNSYPPAEIHRVCSRYGRTYLGKVYDGKQPQVKRAEEQ